MDAQQSSGINEEEVYQAIQEFLKEDEWKKIFEESPEGARERLSLNFYFTICRDKPDFDRHAYLLLRHEIEKSLTFDDLEYLIATSKNDKAIAHYRQLLFSLKGETAQEKGEQENVGQ